MFKYVTDLRERSDLVYVVLDAGRHAAVRVIHPLVWVRYVAPATLKHHHKQDTCR